MSITIVTTVSGLSSNSYVTVAECDEHFQTKPFFFSTWKGLEQGVAFTAFTPATSTVWQFSSSSHGFSLDDQIKIYGTSNSSLHVSQNVTWIDGANVTTDLDSSGAVSNSGYMYKEYAQESLVIEAARAIDTYTYRGTKVVDSEAAPQALEFPRVIDGGTQTIIPAKVKLAQMEMMIFLQTNRDSSTGQAEYREISEVSVDKGLAKVKYVQQSHYNDINVATGGNLWNIKQLLKEYLESDYTFGFNSV